MENIRTSKYVMVTFCGDGGQGCTDGVRTWENSTEGRKQAAHFAVTKREEKYHACGRRSVIINHPDEYVPDKGF